MCGFRGYMKGRCDVGLTCLCTTNVWLSCDSVVYYTLAQSSSGRDTAKFLSQETPSCLIYLCVFAFSNRVVIIWQPCELSQETDEGDEGDENVLTAR